MIGREITFRGRKYKVLERKKRRGKKPPYYLFDVKDKQYLSSLYTTQQPNTYLFDVQGKERFLLTFTDKGYQIEAL